MSKLEVEVVMPEGSKKLVEVAARKKKKEKSSNCNSSARSLTEEKVRVIMQSWCRVH